MAPFFRVPIKKAAFKVNIEMRMYNKKLMALLSEIIICLRPNGQIFSHFFTLLYSHAAESMKLN